MRCLYGLQLYSINIEQGFIQLAVIPAKAGIQPGNDILCHLKTELDSRLCGNDVFIGRAMYLFARLVSRKPLTHSQAIKAGAQHDGNDFFIAVLATGL